MKQNSPDDATLVHLTLAGDHQAFGLLYDRHARSVRAVVGAVSGDWAAVDDMTQDCFLRAFGNLATLRDRQRFGAWIVGIARQVARERKRALGRRRDENVAEPLEVESTSDVTIRLQEDEELGLLFEKLATLPERERLAIHLFFVRERNAEHAAAALELSRSGFYSLLSRAVGRLAALMKSCGHEDKAENR